MLGFDFKKVSQLRRFSEEFEDLGQIGSGGFAEVHRVRNWLDQRIYAAKIVKIKPSCTDDKEDNRLQRAFAEAKAQSHLSHPNIVQYHGCWVELQPFSEEERAEMMEEEQQSEPEFEMILLNESLSSDGIVFGSNSSSDPQQEPLQQQPPKRQKCKKLGDGSALQDYKEIRLFILTELCEMNLQALIYRRSLDRMERDLQPKEILQNYQISLDMMNGLNYLHTKRYIHRDIKLHNIMVGADGNCKLIDFGLAKWVKYWKTSIEDQHITSFEKVAEGEDKYSSSIGTKLFSSPEQASCERYDYRTDLYSLAIVIVLLFHSYTTAHQQRDLLEKVRKRSLEEMKIPQPLKALLFRCLGGENERPSLSQLKKCVRDLMRELILKENLHYSASGKHSVFEKLQEVVEKSKPGKSQKKMKLVAVQES